MRQERTVQASIFDLFAQHEIGCELKQASKWLDAHPALLGLVAADLRRDGVQETGRHGLPAESLFGCAVSRTYANSAVSTLSLEQALACKTGCPLLARSLWTGFRQPRRQGFLGQVIEIPHSNRL